MTTGSPTLRRERPHRGLDGAPGGDHVVHQQAGAATHADHLPRSSRLASLPAHPGGISPPDDRLQGVPRTRAPSTITTSRTRERGRSRHADVGDFRSPLLPSTARPPVLRLRRSSRGSAPFLQGRACSPDIRRHTVPYPGRWRQRPVAEAREWNADLVVVGTHARGWGARLLLGSVAEATLRDAPCDVLAVPPVRAVAGGGVHGRGVGNGRPGPVGGVGRGAVTADGPRGGAAARRSNRLRPRRARDRNRRSGHPARRAEPRPNRGRRLPRPRLSRNRRRPAARPRAARRRGEAPG